MAYMLLHLDLDGWVKCPTCAFSKKTEKSMIVLKELNIQNFKTTPEIDKNLVELLEKLNKIRVLWNHPMTITSGLRDLEHHKEIYRKKGIPDNKIPLQSRHLSGQAADISDPDKKLQEWCKLNEAKLAEIGLWCEDFNFTNNWVHFQSISPGSGKRFFIP